MCTALTVCTTLVLWCTPVLLQIRADFALVWTHFWPCVYTCDPPPLPPPPPDPTLTTDYSCSSTTRPVEVVLSSSFPVFLWLLHVCSPPSPPRKHTHTHRGLEVLLPLPWKSSLLRRRAGHRLRLHGNLTGRSEWEQGIIMTALEEHQSRGVSTWIQTSSFSSSGSEENFFKSCFFFFFSFFSDIKCNN